MNLRVAHVLCRYAGTVPPEWIAAEIDRLKSALDAPLPPKWDLQFAFSKIRYVLGWHLDRDQLESFKSIVQGVQMDRRAKNLSI